MLRVKHYIVYMFSVLVVLAASQPFAYASANTAMVSDHCQTAVQMQTEHCKHMAAMAEMQQAMHMEDMHMQGMPMDMTCCESGECSMDHCIGTVLFVGAYSLTALFPLTSVFSNSETIRSPSSSPSNLYRPPIV